MIHATQLLFMLPLKLVPGDWAKQKYEEGIRETKGAFGKFIAFITNTFAPTSLRITFETEGVGRFTPEEIEQAVIRDKKTGNVTGLDLPKKLVIVANHQMYADWWYLWAFLYFLDAHKDVVIVLKKSLKWAPIVGWGMQVFRFIFLARSWAEDRLVLTSELAKLGRKAEVEDNPISFIIYPEGALVSGETRPKSKKYADKLGIDDMSHTLLPRSTGLLYSLRALSPKVPALKILDVTVAYPGIPRTGYGQSYYTLRSIFMDRIPPPVIHIHLRLVDVASSVPIGNLSSADPVKLPKLGKANGVVSPQLNGQAIPLSTSSLSRQADAKAVEVDVPESEKQVFDNWLQDLWKEKDAKMEEFLSVGEFRSAKDAVEIPVKLKSKTEILDAFYYFGPAVVGYLGRRIFGN